MVDKATKRWIRNASDERAVANGCRFDESRGQWVVDWLAKYLRLYEGDWAGDPFECMEWQHEAFMRIFGWVKHSDRWGREIRRFREGGVWIPKKNGKSPSLAAIGLYLLCGDGEMGQKVFFGAVDGQQAREIAGKHAIEMLSMSPELMSECTINKTQQSITHEPTRSVMKPLSSGNSRTERSKEGLNGSILIDETHVVNRSFMNRISRAGISRSEPLLLEFSTAGDDPDGYGYERWEYGRNVENGTFENDAFFFMEYSAPQDISDEQLAADPIAIGKQANPTWGRMIGEEEFLNDYRQSAPRPREFAQFKMYRLNIWQRTSAPWLRLDDWDACLSPLSIDDFEGCECWLGLDKSKTRDMTALVAIFERDSQYWQFPFFWLPEAMAHKHNDVASFQEWSQLGHLHLIPGEVIHDDPIFDVAEDLAQRFRVQQIRYDRTFAEDITLRFEQDLGWERADFPQSFDHFTPCIDDYERLIVERKLHHDGNPVLRWQAGHCQIREDNKARRMLVKPKREEVKKIDGIVASVMALSGPLAESGIPDPVIY